MENRVNFEFFSKKDDVGTVGQIFVGIPKLVVEEIRPAYLYQMIESFNPIMSKPILPNKVFNLVTVSQGVTTGSPSGEFQIEGLSPEKIAKVREVLSSLDIKVYFRRKSRCSTSM